MNNGNSPLTPYARHVQKGLLEANRSMVFKAAAFGRMLVVGQANGTWKEVPARQILEQMEDGEE